MRTAWSRCSTRRSTSARLFESANELNRRTNVRLISARSSSNPIVQMIAALGLAVVLFIANREIAAGTLTVAEFFPFMIALMQVPQPLRRMLNVAGPLQQGIAAGASVFEVLDAPGEPQGGTRSLARARGEVEFRDVSFEYATRQGRGAASHQRCRCRPAPRSRSSAAPAAANRRWCRCCRASTIRPRAAC